MTGPDWTAWVPSRAEASRVDDALVGLTGQRIAAVRYVDLDYFDEAPPEWPLDDHHNVGQGLEIDLIGGTTLAICWEQRGCYSGLGLWRDPLVPARVTEAKIHDLTPLWLAWGMQRVEQIRTHWVDSFHDDTVELSAVELVDGSRTVLVTLSAALDVLIWPNPDIRRRSILLATCYEVTP